MTNCSYANWDHMYTTSKQIELESPSCSSFEAISNIFRTYATGIVQLNFFMNFVHMNPTYIDTVCALFLLGFVQAFWVGLTRSCAVLRRSWVASYGVGWPWNQQGLKVSWEGLRASWEAREWKRRKTADGLSYSCKPVAVLNPFYT